MAKPPSGAATVGAAWQLVRRRPLMMFALGLFMQLPGLLVELAVPITLDDALRQPLSEVLPKLLQAAQTNLQVTAAVQPLTFVGWVALTAAGLGLARTAMGEDGTVFTQLGHEPLGPWLRRTALGLIPTLVVGALTLAGLLACFAALAAPLVLAWAVGGLEPLGQGGVLQSAPSHPGLVLAVLAYGGFALCAGLIVGSTTLLMVAPVAVGLRTSWGARLRQAWRIGLRHAVRLSMIVFWCQLLGGVVALAAGMAKLLSTDALGMALGVGLGAWVAPLPALAAVLVYREETHVDEA